LKIQDSSEASGGLGGNREGETGLVCTPRDGHGAAREKGKKKTRGEEGERATTVQLSEISKEAES